MIELRQIHHTYASGQGSRPALRGVSLTIARGEAVALMGPTGAGKSTLAQVMSGLLRPSSGEAFWDGLPVQQALRRAGRGRKQAGPGRLPVAYLFQNPEHQLFESTVFDDVAFGPRNLGIAPGEVEERVAQALEAVGLEREAMAARSPFGLSGGEQRRAALAGILALEPEILILDEPTAGLDPAGAERLLSLLEDLHRSGRGLVVVTHRLEEVAGFVERILVLQDGRLVLDGPLSTALAHPDRLAALGVEPPIPLQLAERLRRRHLPLPETPPDAASLIRAIRGLLGGAP